MMMTGNDAASKTVLASTTAQQSDATPAAPAEQAMAQVPKPGRFSATSTGFALCRTLAKGAR
jgi:hypothetical protein